MVKTDLLVSAFSQLTCHLLRNGPLLTSLSHAQLKRYAESCGIVLDHIYEAFNSGVTDQMLVEINDLDPKAVEGEWGPVVMCFCHSIGRPAPNQRPEDVRLFPCDATWKKVVGDQ